MKITVVGAGNVGTQFAVHCAEKGHEVTIYGSKPEKICTELMIINEHDDIIHRGMIYMATSNPQIAFEEAEIIFVTMPASLMKSNAELIEPYARKGLKIGIVPGTGGGECAFKRCIEKGAILFGIQRVPSVARLVEYGRLVRAIGYRNEMYVAALPHSETGECCRIIEDLFNIKTFGLPNYLNITLTPSNPILHTTRLRKLYADYCLGIVYERVPLFYEEWNNETSVLVFKCDDEVHMLCKKLSMFDLSYVKSLRIHYESQTPEDLTRKIRSITGFKGLTSPTKAVDGGYIPDFCSRYFTSDFSFGLSILVQIADFVGLDVPYMKETLNWYYDLVGRQKGFNFCDYGIDSLEKFKEFYSK